MEEMCFKDDVEIIYFLEELRNENIFVWEENGSLKYRSEKKKLPKEVLQKLKNSKAQMIKFFQNAKRSRFLLTPIQSAYYIGQQTGCELGATNAHYYIEYEVNQLDVQKLEDAVNQVILANDALRMVIDHDGTAYTFNHVKAYKIPVYKYDGMDTRLAVREEWSRKQYPIGSWPMFHFHAGKSDTGKDLLHVDFDCIILDAWSAKLMLTQVFEIYNGKGKKVLGITFSQYMREQKPEINEKAKEYWNSMTKEMPNAPKLPYKKKFLDVKEIEFARIEHSFTVEQTKKLYERTKKLFYTPAAVVCTTFLYALSEFSEESAVAVNLTLFNRQPLHKDINMVLGEFTNTAVAKCGSDRTVSFMEEVKNVQKQFWKMVEFRNYDGTEILKKLARGQLGKAVMPIVFTCMLAGEQSIQDSGFKEQYAISQTPQVVLDHHVRDDLGYLTISWDYVKELLGEKEVSQIFTRYVELLTQVIECSDWSTIRRKERNDVGL